MKYLYISLFQDSNEIPKAIPLFSRSASTAKLVRELSNDVRVNGLSKIAVVTGEYVLMK